MISDPKAIVEAYEAGRIRRILLIRISRMGDLLFTTPATRRLKARFPKAELHFLTNPYSRQVLAGNPHISHVHLMDRKGFGWRLFRTAHVISDLKSAHIDLVIPFRWRNEYERLFGKIKAPFVYRLSSGNSPMEQGKHMTERILAGLGALGVKPDGGGMEIFFDAEDGAAIDTFLAERGLDSGPLVVFHTGSHQARKVKHITGAAKRIWPIARWAELAKKLYERNGVPPILSGFSGGEIAANDMIARISGVDAPRFSKGSVNRLAALISRADGLVCGDTGPLHIASAVGAPTVALFGPTRPEVTGPFRNSGGAITLQEDLECVPCRGKAVKCKDNICMQQISAREVFEALLKTLNARASRSDAAGAGM